MPNSMQWSLLKGGERGFVIAATNTDLGNLTPVPSGLDITQPTPSTQKNTTQPYTIHAYNLVLRKNVIQ
jgi:hypothetical protein